MRRLFVATSLFGLLATTGAGCNSRPHEQPQERRALKIGDQAPALKVDKWLQGQEVKEFAPGRAYVVEFWATWCIPCITMMPHIAELQSQYRDQGVTFIGYTAKDPDNTEPKVTAFVKKQGPKLQYTFAYSDSRATYDAWMTAAGQPGIPCSFVVDKTGRIAYIGHPLVLSVVLPKVLAGDTTPEVIADAAAQVRKEFDRAYLLLANETEPKAGLEALAEFEAKYPALAGLPQWLPARFAYLPKLGRVDEAKKLADAVIAKAIERGDPVELMKISSLLRLGPGKNSKELMDSAVKAAEAAVRLTDGKDAQVFLGLASAYFDIGEKAKAKEYGRKAIEASAAEPFPVRHHIEQQVAAFDNPAAPK